MLITILPRLRGPLFMKTEPATIPRSMNACLLGFWLLTLQSPASTLTVVTTNDTGPGSLRQAVLDANAGGLPTQWTILLTNVLGSILLTSSLPPIEVNTTIIGPGADLLAISGNDSFSILQFGPGTTNHVSGLALTNARATNGAAVFNAGVTTLSACALSGNIARHGAGGAIFNEGSLTILNSTISNNRVYGRPGEPPGPGCSPLPTAGLSALGGGLFTTGHLQVFNSTFSSNAAYGGDGYLGGDCYPTVGGAGAGGGVYICNGTACISGCTFHANETSAGIFYEYGPAYPDAQPPGGAGIFTEAGDVTVRHSTISGNLNYCWISSSAHGAGINNTAANVTIENTLVAQNLSGCSFPTPQFTADVGGGFVSLGYNLIGISNYSTGWIRTDLTGTELQPLDPMLGPLTNNGGAMSTMALQPGSPAVDQGISTGIDSDQRGRTRPYDNPAITNAPGGDGCDIGAFELQSPAPIFTQLAHDGSNVWLNLLTEIGWSYRVERTDSLPGTDWATVADNLPGTGTELRLVDPAAASRPMGFYRAVALP